MQNKLEITIGYSSTIPELFFRPMNVILIILIKLIGLFINWFMGWGEPQLVWRSGSRFFLPPHETWRATQVVKLGGKHYHQLSRLAGPVYLLA